MSCKPNFKRCLEKFAIWRKINLNYRINCSKCKLNRKKQRFRINLTILIVKKFQLHQSSDRSSVKLQRNMIRNWKHNLLMIHAYLLAHVKSFQKLIDLLKERISKIKPSPSTTHSYKKITMINHSSHRPQSLLNKKFQGTLVADLVNSNSKKT